MLNGKTLLVVGAGASAEFGLPIGSALIQRIRNRLLFSDKQGRELPDNKDIVLRLRKIENRENKNYGDIDIAAKTIQEGLGHAKSIDNYIWTHSDNKITVEICKLLIADRISQSEADCHLASDGTYKSGYGAEDTWLDIFTRNLFAGCNIENLRNEIKKISILCFNYDRCIEIYLANAIQKYFNIDRKQALAYVEALDIVHPYGTLGSIWPGSEYFPFGTPASDNRIVDASGRIRTFDEGVLNDAVKETIRNQVAGADAVAFLGFGFLRQNFELMQYQQPSSSIFNLKRVYFSTFGTSVENIQQISTMLDSLFRHESSSLTSLRSPMQHTKCAGLLSSHSAEIFGF